MPSLCQRHGWGTSKRFDELMLADVVLSLQQFWQENQLLGFGSKTAMNADGFGVDFRPNQIHQMPR